MAKKQVEVEEICRCEGCTLVVEGPLVVLGPQRLTFCRLCVETRPYCHTCMAPLGASMFLRGRSVCCRCFTGLERCVACRREGCLELEPSPHAAHLKVCGDCRDLRVQPCEFCGETGLVDEEGACARCQQERPEFFDHASEMIWEVRKFLEEAFDLRLRRGFHFLHVPGFPATPVAEGYVVRGDFSVIGGIPRIRVLRELSQPVFKSVFAHEYAHAWQSENCPPQSHDLVEGFARWIQRKVLYELYEDRAAAILDVDEQPGYGPGLRACLAWEHRLGEKGLIRSVKSWREFPRSC